jgi:RNase adaptor protein for sRNA GlmZ degradation
VLIRIMQALGAYGLRGFYERKTHFLQSIPYAVRNIEYLLGSMKLPVEVPALMAVLHGLVGITRLRQFEPAKNELTVVVQSFSYKRGLPVDETEHGGGFIFDCRALPNPGRSEKFATMTGRDRLVAEYLEAEASVQEFLRHVMSLVDQSVVSYRSRNFNHLSVSFGCTGGQHRSVFCAERLAAHLRLHHPVQVRLTHLSLEPATAPTP